MINEVSLQEIFLNENVFIKSEQQIVKNMLIREGIISLENDSINIMYLPKIRKYIELRMQPSTNRMTAASIKSEFNIPLSNIKNAVLTGRIDEYFGFFVREDVEELCTHDTKLLAISKVLENYESAFHVKLEKTIRKEIKNEIMKTQNFGAEIYHGSVVFRENNKNKNELFLQLHEDQYEKMNKFVISRICEFRLIHNYLYLWQQLKKYGKSYKFIQEFYGVVPERQNEKMQPVLHQMMCLLLASKKDISEWTNGDIESLKAKCKTEKLKKEFKRFINTYADAHFSECSFNKQVIVFKEKQDKISKNTEPYSYDTYLEFGYNLFSKEALIEGELLKRVYEDSECAQLVFYCAMLFFCAWRKNDILNSVFQAEIENLDILMKKIEQGDIYNSEFEDVYYEFELMQQGRRASKNGGELILVRSKPLVQAMGVFIVLNKWHMLKDGRDKINPKSINLQNFYNLFGKAKYQKLFGTEIIRHTRINKTYLLRQAQNAYQNKQQVGYNDLPEILGAYLRGHKIDLSKGQNTILHYLSYASSGMTPNEVLDELFAVGGMGHYKTTLCEVILPGYLSLSLGEQSEIANAMNIKPVESERQIEALMRITNDINSIIREGFPLSYEELCLKVGDSLKNRTATGKEAYVTCLFSAVAGKRNPKCDCSDYCSGELGCDSLFCKYGIYSRFYIFNLMNRYKTCAKKLEFWEKKLQGLPQGSDEYDIALNEMVINYQSAQKVDEIIIEFIKALDDSKKIKDSLVRLYEEESDLFDIATICERKSC